MRKFCAAVGLSTVIATALGGCASVGGAASSGVVADAYASGKENFAAGRLGLALVDFQRALQEQGPSVERLNALGATYDRLSRFDLADRAYRQALALDPNAVPTLNNIGYSYLLRGRPDLAAAYLAKAQSLAKDDQTIGANLALVTQAVEQPPAVAAASTTVPSQAEPEPAPAPVQSPRVAVAPLPAPARSAVASLKPQHSTHIEPVAKGVYRLVTIGSDLSEAAAPVLDATLTASIEIPPVIEPMPAVAAVPVSAVQREPLAALATLAPAAGPVHVAAPAEPVAGIVRAVAQVSQSPVAISPALSVARQIHFSAPVPPVAGIIKVAANASEAFVAAEPATPETAPAIESGTALFTKALIEVSNGSGIERSGARFRAYLRGRGVPIRRLTNASRFGFIETVLFYRDGFFEAAQAIALELPMPITLQRNDRQRSDLRLRLGLDSKPFDNYLVAGIVTDSR